MLERTDTRTSAAGVDPTLRTPPPFRLAVSRLGPTVVVTVHGRLDQQSAEPLTTVLRDVIHDQANRSVLVDLRDLSGVDFSTVNLFWDASEWALRRGVSFELHGAPAFATGHEERRPNALDIAPVSLDALRSAAGEPRPVRGVSSV